MRKTPYLALFLFSLAPAAFATTTTFSGEAIVRRIDPTRVAVFLDTNGDQIVDKGFLLTTDLPMGDIDVHIPKANLVFTDGYVRVAADKKVYDLQVAGYPDPPAAPDDTKVVTFIGSALQHSNGDSGCDLKRAESDAGSCYAYGAE
jgi:hypothetical protein